MRLVHCLFYDPKYFLAHPLEILEIWKGGYASHGGAIGLLLAVYWYCRRAGRPTYLWLLDRLAIAAVITGAFIRIGNFFNSEIIGVPTDSVFGVVFLRVDALPRHPVQLYEAITYLAIFLVMLWLYRTKRATANGVLTGTYLALVFSARFGLEFFKTPQAVYEAGNAISVGQYLSLPFVVVGIALLIRAHRNRPGVAKEIL
jgi:prolipoprotein diacylglyceryl transferase